MQESIVYQARASSSSLLCAQLREVEIDIVGLFADYDVEVCLCALASFSSRRRRVGVFSFLAVILVVSKRRKHRLVPFAVSIFMGFEMLMVDFGRVMKDHAYLILQVLFFWTQGSLRNAGNAVLVSARVSGGAGRRWRFLRDDGKRKSLLQFLDGSDPLPGDGGLHFEMI